MGITPSPFVVSVSSTAKIIAPGLRVGWIEASEDLVLQLNKSALVMSGGSISHFSASIVGAAMRSGLAAKCVSRLVNLHQKRARALCEVDIQLARNRTNNTCKLRFCGNKCVRLPRYQSHRRCNGTQSRSDAPSSALQAGTSCGCGCRWPRLILSKLALAPCYSRWWSVGQLVPCVCGVEVLSVKPTIALKAGSKFGPDATSGRWDRHVRLCFARLSCRDLEEGVRVLCGNLRKLLLVKQNHARI